MLATLADEALAEHRNLARVEMVDGSATEWLPEPPGDERFLNNIEVSFFWRLPLALDSVLRARTLDALQRSMRHDADYLWRDCRSRITDFNRGAISESQLIDDLPDHIVRHGDQTELRRTTRLERTAEGLAVVVKLVAHGAQLGEFVVERLGSEARFSRQECSHIRVYAEMCSPALHGLLAMEELRRLALTDQLTGVPNRRALLNELENLAHESKGVALLFLDANGLKAVNEKIGYQAGDTLIAALAEVLKSAIGDDGFAGRLGGDEFVAILRNADESRAKRVKAEIENAYDSWPLPAEIRVHCQGVSAAYVIREDDEPSTHLLQRAEQEMKAGRKRRRDDRAR
jgi:diguanylate cyclase (GGDEF)-like protein